MRHPGSLALVLLLGSTPFTIQSSGQKLQSAAPMSAYSRNSCPITIVDAEQTSVGHILPIKNRQFNGPAQRLHMIAWNFESEAIVGARIRVEGLTGELRAVDTQVDSQVRVLFFQPYPSKTFEVAVNLGAEEDASITLLLRGFKAINFVSLDSVTYSDGSSWHSSVSETCHVPVRPSVLPAGVIIQSPNALPR
jgi:hypothetical protein